MKRSIGTIAVIAAAAAASLAGTGTAHASTTAYQPDIECEKQFVAAVPGFVVRTAAYTVEHGEPPFIGGPFINC